VISGGSLSRARTLYILQLQTIHYESRAAREMALGAQMEHGVALGYERLEKLLESLQARKEAKK
jgi:hypothetical protein